ncbi:TonB family protein [Sulfurimonas sp. HSL-1716]|uniref:energy transducer TonB n=1 Tax=Hydrocurvibacter sulfurireducens TaxID=3131937 RepID=UPI0031F8D27A
MIRHSSSFSISLIFHILVLVFAVLMYNYASSQREKRRVAVDLSRCVMNCECGCMPKAEEKIKQTPPKPKEPPKKKIEKKIKKKIEKKTVKKVAKKEPKKVLVKKTPEKPIEKEVKKIVETKEVVEKTPPPAASTSVEEEAPQEKVPVEKEDTAKQEEQKLQERKRTLQKRYINENLQKIVQMLKDNLYYPTRARKRGIEGDVVVKFTLLKNSEIKDVTIIKHSHDILDSSAVKTIENLQGKLPAPSEEMVLEVPINYRLN